MKPSFSCLDDSNSPKSRYSEGRFHHVFALYASQGGGKTHLLDWFNELLLDNMKQPSLLFVNDSHPHHWLAQLTPLAVPLTRCVPTAFALVHFF